MKQKIKLNLKIKNHLEINSAEKNSKYYIYIYLSIIYLPQLFSYHIILYS